MEHRQRAKGEWDSHRGSLKEIYLWFFLCMWICTTCFPTGPRGKKRALDPLESELQTVVEQTVVYREPNPGPLQEQQMLLPTVKNADPTHRLSNRTMSAPSSCLGVVPGHMALPMVAIHQPYENRINCSVFNRGRVAWTQGLSVRRTWSSCT